jgi:HAD superfamily hydrolase (TIGR01509 family)
MSEYRTGVVLDLDGTLVDSVHHHVLAWDQVLRGAGLEAPLWRVHRAIGMGGDRLLPWVLGRSAADLGDLIDELKSRHEEAFLARADAVRPTPGGPDLIDDLTARGVPFVVATSASGAMVDVLLGVLGRKDFDLTHGDEVDTSKPGPDSVLAACEQLGVEPVAATMVGDSPWDAEAATRIGARAIGVRCGGFGATELTDAGAMLVVDDPRALLGRL